jgi:site-specific DNA recombinase
MKENLALNKRVAIWIRVSTEDQAKGDSPEIHEERARAYAKAKEWDVVEIYDLAGVKGWSGKSVIDHPECRRMMADIKRGHITGLIFSKLARLSRNKRELEDFAEFFRTSNADMISLGDSIDTSTPAGRMFYSFQAAWCQCEREETADRIKASFLTRAKMGKLLNRSVPYGYKVEDGKMVLHPEEAPIRREVYELFLQHRRKFTVGRILNEKGYRTRKGRLWEEIQIKDMLTDPSAKGVYFFNREKRTGAWKGIPKPESEWGRVECPRIVSDEVWSEANRILEETRRSWKQPGRLPTQPFSKLAWCECGGKMYARTDSPKYLCRKCNNKIAIPDLEKVFHEKLKGFFSQPDQIAALLRHSEQALKEKEMLLAVHQQTVEKLREEMKQTHRLYIEGHITAQGFGEFYKPAEQRLNQLVAELPQLQGEIDAMKMHQLSSEVVVSEANTLYDRWPSFEVDDRRMIAETLCEKITIGESKIRITFTGAPSSGELCKNLTRL